MNYIFLSIWQVQIHMIAFWSGTNGDMFQMKIDRHFSGLPNVLGIADDISVAGFNLLRRDPDENRQSA